jgi:Domain of unknown function (DUF4864)
MTNRGKIALVLLALAVCGTAPLARYWLEHRRETVRPAELYQVVYSQLSAFRTSDFTRAYWQASSGIQQKFNREQFTEMIRREYPGIARAERIEFGLVRSREQHARIQVFFIARDGSVTPAIYSLIHEGEEWKIDGARMLRRWPEGARLRGLRS